MCPSTAKREDFEFGAWSLSRLLGISTVRGAPRPSPGKEAGGTAPRAAVTHTVQAARPLVVSAVPRFFHSQHALQEMRLRRQVPPAASCFKVTLC